MLKVYLPLCIILSSDYLLHLYARVCVSVLLCCLHWRINVFIVGVGRIFKSVCLSVCLFVCPQHNSKTNDPKVFKLGTGNDLAMS